MTHCHHFKDLPTLYLQTYLKYISNENLSRRTASTIFQLRVGHPLLNQYLHRFKKVDNLQCPACGHPKETTKHFLLQCPKYAHERWPILNARGGRPPMLAKLLSNLKLLLPLVNYMDTTGHFEIKLSTPFSK